jgi:hypothetical protein
MRSAQDVVYARTLYGGVGGLEALQRLTTPFHAKIAQNGLVAPVAIMTEPSKAAGVVVVE